MKYPQLLLILCALLWSSGGLLIKLVDWSPLAIAGGRSAIAAAVIWVFLPRPKFQWSRWTVAGAVAYAATVITFVIATKWTTAANAIFLQFTAPVYVAIFSGWVLREKVHRADWIRMAFAQTGILLFFLGDLSWTGVRGTVVGLASGVAFAALIVLLRKQKDTNPAHSVLIGNLMSAVICLPAMLGPLPPAKSLLALSYLGVFQLGVSYLLFTRAIRRVPALSAVLIGAIEPVLNPIWVMLVLGEVPGWPALFGGAIVIGSAVAQGWATAKPRPAPAVEKEVLI